MRRMTALRLPATFICRRARGRYPALVGVHGGGWVQGARGQFQHWGKYLAARGVALFAISYRFATAKQKTFPHAVQDVLAAIQFVRGNAKDFNIAPDRIGVFGHSAGGNLGALAALGGRSPLFANGYPQDAARQGEHRGEGVRRRLRRL